MSIFNRRTEAPSYDNKYYLQRSYGGFNSAISGKPLYCDGSVLSNCVGYANGRFGEIIAEITGKEGIRYNTLNCDAENFIERAIKAGLDIDYNNMRLGGIAVFAKGKPGEAGDGSGHVLVVEHIYSINRINCSESFYGGSAFVNQDRNNANGRWGLGEEYTFRGCIINPFIPGITEPVERNKHERQINIDTDLLHCRVGAGLNESVLGYIKPGIYTYTDTAEANGYTWYKVAKNNWVAGVEGVEVLEYVELNIKAELIKLRDQLNKLIEEV